MAFFGKPAKASYLGVDIGAGGVKIAELASEKGRARLVTYGFSEQAPEDPPLNAVTDTEAIGALVKKVAAKAGCSSRKAVAGIPVSQVFSSVLTVNVPSAKKKELREAINAQARKITPRPIEEMVIDFKIVEEGEKATKALLTGAESSLVRKYIDIFKTAGLELLSLETEAFALIRSLVGRDRSSLVIVDIGAVRTNISVIDKGIPLITRSLDLGGVTFTRALAGQSRLGLAAAEQMKVDLGALASALPPSGLPPAMAGMADTVINELKYVLNLTAGQRAGASGAAVEKIVLAGGGALLPRLADVIGQRLDIRTIVGDPWARVVYPEDLRPVLDQIGSRFAVAIGLAMRDIE